MTISKNSPDGSPTNVLESSSIMTERNGGPANRIRAFVNANLRAILLSVAACALSLFIFNPFRPLADDELSVASHWKKSIGSIGVTAVYPPQEDFHVGDILLIVDGDHTERNAALLGQSVRVGHIDVRPQLRAAQEGRLSFKASEFGPDHTLERQQSIDVVEDDGILPIRPTSIAFPTVEITRNTISHGLFGLDWGVLGGNRHDAFVDKIAVPNAATYGIDASDADALLVRWCRAAQTAKYCLDENARTLLAFLLDPALLDRVSGKFRYQVKLQLVTRVYLTRSIEHTFGQTGSRNVGAGEPAVAMADSIEPAERSATGDNLITAPTAPTDGRTAQGASFKEAGRSEQTMSDTHLYPVVFGYRAFSVMLRRKNE